MPMLVSFLSQGEIACFVMDALYEVDVDGPLPESRPETTLLRGTTHL